MSEQAVALHQAGKAGEAERLCLQALDTSPDDFDACQLLGVIYFQQGSPAKALEFFDRAAALKPGFAILSNRGAALQMLNRIEEALASYDQALAIQPDSAVLLYNRGRALQDMSRFEEALDSYDKALRLDPNFSGALNNRANALRSLNRHAEALASYDRALAIKPDYAEALYNRGNMQWSVNGNYGVAVRDLEKAVALNPAYDYALGELLYLRMHGGDWRDFETLRSRVIAGVRAGRRVAQPFHYQAVSDSPADLQACSVIFTNHHFPPAPPLANAGRRAAEKIRLGYVAGEFREHATAWLMTGLFESHNREKFELFAFDNGWDDGSAMRARLTAAFGNMIDISRLSNRAAAEKIAAMEIDILVNLNGYVGLHRMGVFAHRPAPIQASYLGSPATMGAPYIDYFLADRILIPQAEEKFYSEKVVILPDSYQVNDSKRALPGKPPGRAALRLPEKNFVFCSFNSSYKLTPEIFSIWMNILRAAPQSVLWLLENNPEFAGHLRRAAIAAGVVAERLIFAPMVPLEQHLARMQEADLFLDLLPCGGHTTASDALWAGVPLLTCRGGALPGRVAASLLHAVGLPELVTESLADYQALALRLAGDPALLAGLRQKLAQNRLTMPLFDTERSRRHIEAAYTSMWEMFQRGDAPRGFAVNP
ncbi:MAG TPA: tetratricopeptide repeat protein [Rhizomicrobium sp.]|nr:tetratricopeptide repeat protein [Rhizomicrobium sp.]